MRKIIFCLLIVCAVSCDFKDKNGNAPLIEDADGNLVDNPDYKTAEQEHYDKVLQPSRDALKESLKDGTEDVVIFNEPTVQDREHFITVFKSKTSAQEMKLSGDEKTTITFISAFNTPYTVEQFDNLHYYDKLRELGFKKVIFSDGVKTTGEKDL